MSRKTQVLDSQTDTLFVTTNTTDAVDVRGAVTLYIDAQVTNATPSAKSFATSDVNTTDNTITEASHGYPTGLKGQFTTTTTLPAGLSLATDYFVIATTSGTYKVATSLANAQAGTAVDITDQGTGTHTFTPTSLAGGSVKLQESLDGTIWHDSTNGSQNITATANFFWSVTAPGYDYVRLSYTLTAGALTAITRVATKIDE